MMLGHFASPSKASIKGRRGSVFDLPQSYLLIIRHQVDPGTSVHGEVSPCLDRAVHWVDPYIVSSSVTVNLLDSKNIWGRRLHMPIDIGLRHEGQLYTMLKEPDWETHEADVFPKRTNAVKSDEVSIMLPRQLGIVRCSSCRRKALWRYLG